ncbi:MAG TPA: glycosyltransferase family 4 protein [Flavisolibacter sp.]
MKILMIHCFYQLKAGEETVVEEEVALLEKIGIEVELLKFHNKGRVLAKYLQLPFNFSSYLAVKKKIKQFRPDVVHVHNLHFSGSPSVIYAVKNSKVPLVCTLHNYRLLCPSNTLFYNGQPFLDSLQRTFPLQAVKKGVYRNSKLLTFWMGVSMQIHHWFGTWKTPDRFIVLSNHAKDMFSQSKMKFREGQLIVKPNFCASPRQEDCERSDTFVYVGRLSKDKGVALLLQVFSSSSYRIVLAGDGPLKDEVIASSKKYSNITYAGILSKVEIVELLSSSSALIFPSIWYEGMPLTIIEALACGTPVIASKLGVMEHMISHGHDGLLFEANNPNCLAQAIDWWNRLSTSEKERYRRNARSAYEKSYTPEKNAEQLISIYQSVRQEQLSVTSFSAEITV